MSEGRPLAATQAFFGERAARWDTKFGDDGPAYAAAVAEAEIRAAGSVADVGCGTGRALTPLRAAVGAGGVVLGIDATPEMLDEARARAGQENAGLVLADAMNLPLADAGLDAVFAAGLVNHLPDPGEGLTELARVTRPGGRLVLFHPTGRAALAARHHRELRPDEPYAEGVLPGLLARAGWRLDRYDDAVHRFFARAVRVEGAVRPQDA